MKPMKLEKYTTKFLCGKTDVYGSEINNPKFDKNTLPEKLISGAFLSKVMRLTGHHTSLSNIKDHVEVSRIHVSENLIRIYVTNKQEFKNGMVRHVFDLLKQASDSVNFMHCYIPTNEYGDYRKKPRYPLNNVVKSSTMMIDIFCDVLNGQPPKPEISIKKPVEPVDNLVDHDMLAAAFKKERDRLSGIVDDLEKQQKEIKKKLVNATYALSTFKSKFY